GRFSVGRGRQHDDDQRPVRLSGRRHGVDRDWPPSRFLPQGQRLDRAARRRPLRHRAVTVPAGGHPGGGRKDPGGRNSASVMTTRGPIYATVSIGGVSFPDEGLTSYDVITRAETA